MLLRVRCWPTVEPESRALRAVASVFPTELLSVHVRKLDTGVRKSTTKSDLQNLQNRYQCRSELTSHSFVIQRRDAREGSHGCCRVANLVHACMRKAWAPGRF